MAQYTADFDPAVTCPGHGGQVVTHAAAIEKMAATVKSLATAWEAESGSWRSEGSRSPAHELARRTGTSLGAARQALEVGQRLARQPLVDAAARRGELSAGQAALVSDASEADPAAEAKLVAVAALGSMAELRERCGQVKANAEPDLEARRRRIHSQRHLRAYTDPEGTWYLRAQGNPEHGVQVMSALGPIADQIFAEARAQGRREPPDAYAFDALVRLANSVGAGAAGAGPGQDAAGQRGAGQGGAEGGGVGESPTGPGGTSPGSASRGGGASPRLTSPSSAGSGSTGPRRSRPTGVSRTKVIVRIDFEALLRGYPVSGETCELVGYGPVAVSAVRDMLDTDDPFVAAVVTKGQALMGVAHLGRRPNAYPAKRPGVAVPVVCSRGLPGPGSLGVRSPPRLGDHPPHGVRLIGPAVWPPPRPQDQGELVAGRRVRQAGLRSPRRSPPPPPQPVPAQGAATPAIFRAGIRVVLQRPVPQGVLVRQSPVATSKPIGASP